jgi:hypothetical protein
MEQVRFWTGTVEISETFGRNGKSLFQQGEKSNVSLNNEMQIRVRQCNAMQFIFNPMQFSAIQYRVV